MGTAGTQIFLRFVERLRLRLLRMQDNIEDVIREYSRPIIGHRRNLYMNKLVDTIAKVGYTTRLSSLITAYAVAFVCGLFQQELGNFDPTVSTFFDRSF